MPDVWEMPASLWNQLSAGGSLSGLLWSLWFCINEAALRSWHEVSPEGLLKSGRVHCTCMLSLCTSCTEHKQKSPHSLKELMKDFCLTLIFCFFRSRLNNCCCSIFLFSLPENSFLQNKTNALDKDLYYWSHYKKKTKKHFKMIITIFTRLNYFSSLVSVLSY